MSNERRERAAEIVAALKCDETLSSCARHETCPYHSADYNHIGIGYGCDRERIDLDAADLIEQLAAEPPNDPLTNADRIRAMSDEELADNRVGEILGIAPCPLWVAIDAPEKQYLSKKTAIEVELAWLQQPTPKEGEQNER